MPAPYDNAAPGGFGNQGNRLWSRLGSDVDHGHRAGRQQLVEDTRVGRQHPIGIVSSVEFRIHEGALDEPAEQDAGELPAAVENLLHAPQVGEDLIERSSQGGEDTARHASPALIIKHLVNSFRMLSGSSQPPREPANIVDLQVDPAGNRPETRGIDLHRAFGVSLLAAEVGDQPVLHQDRCAFKPSGLTGENPGISNQERRARSHHLRTSSKASRKTAKPSSSASRGIHRGGAILRQPPPSPTGESISKPFR